MRDLRGHTPFDARLCQECGLEAAEPEAGDKHGHHVTCRACGTTQTHLLKALPCTNCPAQEPTTSLGYGQQLAVARLPDGSPYLMGSVPQGITWPWRYPCSACKMSTLLSATDFNRLRLMEPAEYLALLP